MKTKMDWLKKSEKRIGWEDIIRESDQKVMTCWISREDVDPCNTQIMPDSQKKKFRISIMPLARADNSSHSDDFKCKFFMGKPKSCYDLYKKVPSSEDEIGGICHHCREKVKARSQSQSIDKKECRLRVSPAIKSAIIIWTSHCALFLLTWI